MPTAVRPAAVGFAILEPVADGVNNAIVAPSQILGTDLRNAFLAGTGEPVSSYDGTNGIQPRNDLGGTNLSTVPKVFIECANMRNATDAALIVSPTWQARAAQAISSRSDRVSHSALIGPAAPRSGLRGPSTLARVQDRYVDELW